MIFLKYENNNKYDTTHAYLSTERIHFIYDNTIKKSHIIIAITIYHLVNKQ
jgi:hypothetical protein